MTEAEVREILDSLPAPPFRVVRWEVETGEDSLGKEAVWIWAIVDDDRVPELDQVFELENAIQERIRRLHPSDTPWVYLRPRLLSES